MKSSLPTHNLDILSYSLEDIYGLFHLSPSLPLSLESLKNAKKIVLKLHPDISKLDPKYFLFYKKAFDIIVHYYNEDTKQYRPVVDETYTPLTQEYHKQVKKTIEKMDSQDFHRKFNQIFDENAPKKTDPKKYAWFSDPDAPTLFSTTESSLKREDMGRVFQQFKEKQQGIILHRGIEEYSSQAGCNLYEEDDEQNDYYITTDIFSRLKFDDVRKVHKDQPIMTVGEVDYEKIPKFHSVEQYQRYRGEQISKPLEREDAELHFQQKQKASRERMMLKQYESEKKTEEFAKMNQRVLSNFLYLQ
jgi:hypothetical protein